MSNHNDTQPNSGAVLEFPDHKSIHTQASQWLAKLDAEQPSQRDLARFKQWVNADPAHRIAFEELVDFWDEMNILTQAVLPRELMHPDQPTAKTAEQTPTSASGRRFFPNTRATFATGFVAIAGIVLAFMLQLGSVTVYSTGIGEQRTIQLADNSTVQLNTNSRLEVDYSDSVQTPQPDSGRSPLRRSPQPQQTLRSLRRQPPSARHRHRVYRACAQN